MTPSPWNLLGIPPTKDEAAIQRAYAEAVKDCHPEDKPEGWAALHDAYQQALRYAQGGAAAYTPPAGTYRTPERAPEPEFSEDFRAALFGAENAAARVTDAVHELARQKTPITSAQAQKLAAMLYDLNPGREEDRTAASAALRLFSDKICTAEAYEGVFAGLGEWRDSLPQAALRAEADRTLKTLASVRKAAAKRSVILRDGIFSLILTAFSVLMTLGSDHVGAFAASIELTVIAGAIYLLATRKRWQIPREKGRGRKLSGALLALVLVLAVGSGFAARYFAQLGYGEITEQVAWVWPDYDPALTVGTKAAFTVAEEPRTLCHFASLTDTNGKAGGAAIRREAYYYGCVGADGQRALVYVSDWDRSDFEALEPPVTIYGNVAAIESNGIFMPPDLALMSDFETLLETRAAVEEAGAEIGEHPVLRFSGTDPGYKTVSLGFEPGHYPFTVCWSLCVGSTLYLCLLLFRRYTLYRKVSGNGS